MPSSDEGTITVTAELPQGTQLETTDNLVKQIEEKLKDYKDVETISSNVGSGGMMSMLGASSSNQATITITLSEKRKASTADAVQEVRRLL